MDDEPRVEVRAATGRFDDLAVVVGTLRPGARGCWCMAYRDSRVDAEARPEYMRALCGAEPGPGVLVYVDDDVAGWCSVAPRSSYRRLLRSRTIPAPDDPGGWAIVCFVVRAGYRRQGLMHHLLTGAVGHATASGARVVEGYPAQTSGGRVNLISGYVGTVALFERAGFEQVGVTSSRSGGAQRWIMRRTLM